MTELRRLQEASRGRKEWFEALVAAAAAGMLIRREYPELEDFTAALRREGISRTLLYETFLQVYLFDGFPAAVEGLTLLQRVWPEAATERKSGAGETSTTDGLRAAGEVLCRRIYGDNYFRLMEQTVRLSPELNEWFLVEGYGKVLSRGILDIRIRELVIVALLLEKNYPRQLHSHLRGALNVGVEPQLLKTVLEIFGAGNPGLLQEARKWWQKYVARMDEPS